MKKTFIVEIEYEELPENVEKEADVLYDVALESHIENIMYDYKQHDSIIGDYEVNVEQIDNKIIEKVKEMTLRQLMINITNDCQEDADTGFSWELSIEEYLKSLFNL